MGHSSGDGCFVCMVHDRWIEVAWQPHVVVGDSRQTGGEPCGDTWSRAVSLAFSKRTDILCIGDKVLLCESSGEYSETVIPCSIVTRINEECYFKGRKVGRIHG